MEEFWEVRLTGVATSPSGVLYEDLECVVATVSSDGFIKVWPKAPTGNGDDGKIWFPIDKISKIEILCIE